MLFRSGLTGSLFTEELGACPIGLVFRSFLIVLTVRKLFVMVPLFIFSLMLIAFGNGTDFVLVLFR